MVIAYSRSGGLVAAALNYTDRYITDRFYKMKR